MNICSHNGNGPSPLENRGVELEGQLEVSKAKVGRPECL